MANVLVVGGAGYLGGVLTDRLCDTRHNARVYDNLLYEESYSKPVDFVKGDVRDFDRLQPHLEWADVVVWLAAIVGDEVCALNSKFSVEVNETALVNALARFHGRIIYTSTCSVYGASEGILDESSPVNPLSLYAQLKLRTEQQLLHGKNVLIFRLGTLFGAGDLFSRLRLDLVVNLMAARAFQNKRIDVYGGSQHRPLLHVKDAAEAFVQNLETSHVGIFNLHSENIRIQDLAKRYKIHFPDVEIHQVDVENPDRRDYKVSSQKATSTFRFQPRHTLDDGIQGIKALLEQGRVKDISNPRYYNFRYLKECSYIDREF